MYGGGGDDGGDTEGEAGIDEDETPTATVEVSITVNGDELLHRVWM